MIGRLIGNYPAREFHYYYRKRPISKQMDMFDKYRQRIFGTGEKSNKCKQCGYAVVVELSGRIIAN